MKIIRNDIIPFKGFRAINLFGILFVRGNAYVSDRTINHESIHTAQMKEMLYVGFYLWYVVEWLVRLVMYLDFDKAYRNISFEREAYEYDENMEYLRERESFAWIKLLLL